MAKQKGTIEKKIYNKGFGFITGQDSKQYFFHKSMLADRRTWRTLRVGESVEFNPAQGKKGIEAHDISACTSNSRFSNIDDIPGVYGLVAIQRGTYTNPEKNMQDSPGLAFVGVRTFGGRFPRNDKMIGLLRDMRAVFDRDNKIWFLRAEQVEKNIDRIDALVKESKRLKRIRLLKSFFSGLGTLLIVLFFSSIAVAGVGLVILMAVLGGMASGPKISYTGNVWFAGKRYT